MKKAAGDIKLRQKRHGFIVVPAIAHAPQLLRKDLQLLCIFIDRHARCRIDDVVIVMAICSLSVFTVFSFPLPPV